MNLSRRDRREFLHVLAAGAAGVLLGSTRVALAGASSLVKIQDPFHGAVLNRRHGQDVNGGLKIRVSGEAARGDRVWINETPAKRSGTKFSAEIVLREKETEIVAASKGVLGRAEHRIRVLWNRNSFPRYRFSVDDNSFFLRDIAQKKICLTL